MAYSSYLVGIIGVVLGLVIGLLAGLNPLYAALTILGPGFILFFFENFELTAIGLLVLRSALDPFSEQGITGAFAVGLSALTILYVTVCLLRKKPVHIDGFWCFLTAWIAIQGLWVILLPIGGLGAGSDRLPEASREWVRISSWSMCYLLTLQLKQRLSPERVVNSFFLALIIPVGTAILQLLVPGKFLPWFLAVNANQDGFRINGTLGVANTFVTFLILFISLTYWKISNTQKRLPWIVLMGILIFFLVATKVLVGISMLVVLIVVMVAPRLSFSNLMGAIVVLTLMFGLFASTDVGKERLASISQTPLLNPDIDESRAIILAASDGNSFNWRVAQWNALIGHWKDAPVLGHGLQTSNSFRPMFAFAHNDYVRSLVEEGIVGITLFLSFLGIQILRLLRIIFSSSATRPQRSLCLSLLAFLLAAMVGMLTENVWSHTALFFYWFSMSATIDWEWGRSEAGSDVKLEPRLAHFQ